MSWSNTYGVPRECLKVRDAYHPGLAYARIVYHALHVYLKLHGSQKSIAPRSKSHQLRATPFQQLCGTYIYWFDVFINLFWIWKEKIPLHNNV